MSFRILKETENWFVIEKPAFIHSVGGKTSGSVAQELAENRPELSDIADSGLVHRLDFETTGCLLVAKNVKAHAELKEQLRDSEAIQKIYLCVTSQRVEATEMTYYFHSRYRASKKISVLTKGKASERGTLICRELAYKNPYRIFEVELIGPGKRHQIRASFAHQGAPLLGDKLYGSLENFEGIALHSWQLRMGNLVVKCPLPATWKNFQTSI